MRGCKCWQAICLLFVAFGLRWLLPPGAKGRGCGLAARLPQAGAITALIALAIVIGTFAVVDNLFLDIVQPVAGQDLWPGSQQLRQYAGLYQLRAGPKVPSLSCRPAQCWGRRWAWRAGYARRRFAM